MMVKIIKISTWPIVIIERSKTMEFRELVPQNTKNAIKKNERLVHQKINILSMIAKKKKTIFQDNVLFL